MKKPSRFVFVCGILSSAIYILTDIITGLITPGYSFNSQTVSELSAVGSLTRPVWQVVTFIYNPLLIIFGLAVRKLGTNHRNTTHLFSGILIIIWGILGFVWLLFPMNLRGNIGSSVDTMHLVMTGITVFLMTVLIVIGSGIHGKRFRLYSFLTLLSMVVFGILTGQQTSKVAAQLPTPWMGITERITSYLPLIWVAVLAASFLSDKTKNK